MPRELAGREDATGLRIAVVVARFNGFVTEGLLSGALAALRERGADDADVTVVRVPGAFEIPLAARAAASRGDVDAVVCLAAVIRGDTAHFDYVCRAVTDGVGQAMLALGVPMAFGVLTTDTVEQALERAGEGSGNKGAEAAHTAIEMVHVLRGVRRG